MKKNPFAFAPPTAPVALTTFLSAGLASLAMACSSSSSGSGATVTGMTIVASSGAPLQAAAGDAIPLKVVQTMSDGTTQDLPAGTSVSWIAPSTVVAEDPDDAGADSVLPATGAEPTGIFIDNPFRTDRTDYAGTLFVIDPGTGGGGTLTVTASVGDAGTVSGSVSVAALQAGDPVAGGKLYNQLLQCSECHGATAGGSTPDTDGGDMYDIMGQTYAYPAPALNNTMDDGDPNLGADPGWNAALLSMSALGDIDNNGVALRVPMPDWLGKKGVDGGPLGGQDFADIYAFLVTQTQ